LKGSQEILKDRFIENNFTHSRLIAAVNHVIDNYQGWDKHPSIANFISYDKKIKVFTYIEAISYGMGYLKMINIGFDKPGWALEEHVLQYNLEEWIAPKPKPKEKAELNLTPEERTENLRKINKDIRNMSTPGYIKPKVNQFTREEKKERLEKFNKEHGID